MIIDQQKCIKCKKCQPLCPVQCIKESDESLYIEHDDCLECGICLRNSNCPKDAIYQPLLEMPRAVRKAFSDPFGKHENTTLKHMGRGTEEIKTNDVTGIISTMDRVAVAVEMGRPGIGTSFKDIEKLTKVVSKHDVKYEVNNPLTAFIIDKATGIMDPTLMNEKILSGIIEFSIEVKNLENLLKDVKEESYYVDTVFSVCIISKVDNENKSSVEDLLISRGYNIKAASSKTNLGLGRPLYQSK